MNRSFLANVFAKQFYYSRDYLISLLTSKCPREYTTECAKTQLEKYKEIDKLSCEIFGTMYNPQKLRTGIKYIKRRLLGSQNSAYWPMTTKELLRPASSKENEALALNHGIFNKASEIKDTYQAALNIPAKEVNNITHNKMKTLEEFYNMIPMTNEEVYRRTVVERNKSRNKAPPKKGQGKRAATKTKKK